jgi:hypothetical protein
LPGEFGPDATVEVDPHRIGPVRMRYSPQTTGADPGEVVWTWVPFEENDGRGKDRPVLVVAVEPAGTYLAVQLIGKDHDGEGDFVSVGAGAWDGEHRPSWVQPGPGDPGARGRDAPGSGGPASAIARRSPPRPIGTSSPARPASSSSVFHSQR